MKNEYLNQPQPEDTNLYDGPSDEELSEIEDE